jgi:hypothetical protein
MTIDIHSVMALHTQMQFNGNTVASGTSFFVQRNGEDFIVTNRHNVTGRNNETDELLGRIEPDALLISAIDAKGRGFQFKLPLYDTEGNPGWLEHPTLGPRADIAALPFSLDGSQRPVPIEPSHLDGVPTLSSPPNPADGRIRLSTGTEVVTIGYPFGLAGGAEAVGVWIRGMVATEPDLDYSGLPMFLIDSRTRTGQSGSPVFYHSASGSVSLTGGTISTAFLTTSYSQFIGIYSGRINSEADLGRVWRVDAVRATVDSRRAGVARLPGHLMRSDGTVAG